MDTVARTVYVLPEENRIEIYSLDGDYLEGMPLPSQPNPGARLSDGTIAMPISRGDSKIRLVAGDSIFSAGPEARMSMPGELLPGDGGVWIVEAPWYQFDHHVLPSGKVDWSIQRDVDWFPRLTDEEGSALPGPLVRGFAIDRERGTIFSRIELVADQNAPSSPIPPRVPLSERDEVFGKYFDGVIEGFTLDGALIASTRFDNFGNMPWPIGGGS